MPIPSLSVPKYCRHKASGQARVHLAGRDLYLGVYGSEESRAEYRRLIAEYLAAQNTAVSGSPTITINELIDAFWAHAVTYYVKDGQPTGEQQALKYALRPVATLYGHKPVTDFGPVALRTAREQMVTHGYCRPLINRYVHRIRRVFRWGVSHEMVPPDVLQRLETVEPLRKAAPPPPSPARSGRSPMKGSRP